MDWYHYGQTDLVREFGGYDIAIGMRKGGISLIVKAAKQKLGRGIKRWNKQKPNLGLDYKVLYT